MRTFYLIPILMLAGAFVGCMDSSNPPPRQPYPQYANVPPGQYPPGQYPSGQYPPGQYPPGPQPTAAPPATAQPATALPQPPIGAVDATGALTPPYIRAEAKAVLDELVAALADANRQRVQGIPLMVIEDPGEVNAFAGCDKSGKAFMGITGPLLTLTASGSEARAYDELNGTKAYDQYTSDIAAKVRAQQPVAPIPPGTLPLPNAIDPRKLAREKFLFDEQVAFVLGHELAHHYRGHTGCANGGVSGGVTPADIGGALSNVVPVFNQPMEVEADMYGVSSALDAGARRGANGVWTEEGALMTLGFFSKLESFGVQTVVLGFLRTHPPSQLRIPIVQNTAANWHRQHQGGSTTPTTPSPFPFPLPLPW